MKVVVVTSWLFPEHLELWRACRDLGVDITVVGTDFNFYRDSDWPWAPAPPDDLPSVVLQAPFARLAPGNLWLWYRGFGPAVRRIGPDIIHVNSEPWGLLVAEALATKTVTRGSLKVCAHGCDNIYRHGRRSERAARRLALRAFFPRIDGFASWNVAGIDLAHQHGFMPAKPTMVVPGVVPAPEHFPEGRADDRGALRARFQLPQDRVVVGFFGRLVPEKAPVDAIHAVAGIPGRPAFLAVWGTGPLAGLVGDELARRPESGRYLGPLTLAEVPAAMAACDIVVVPSRTTPEWAEQFGRVAVEAMLAGCAVVAYDSGALSDVLGADGALVAEGDLASLSREIGRLAADPGARADLARRGRARAIAEFHPRRLAEKTVAFWEAVAAS